MLVAVDALGFAPPLVAMGFRLKSCFDGAVLAAGGSASPVLPGLMNQTFYQLSTDDVLFSYMAGELSSTRLGA
jgi:hypothetical protein